MSNVSGLWGIGTLSSCLVSGPGMVRREECCFLQCKSQIEEVVQSISSGFVGLYMTHMVLGRSFATFYELATPGKAGVSPGSRTPDAGASRIQKTAQYG